MKAIPRSWADTRLPPALLALLTLVCFVPRGWAQGPNDRTKAFIKQFGLTDAEMGAVNAGEIVARMLPTKDDNDVAIVGVVHVAAPAQRLAEKPDDLATFLKNGPVLEHGRFSDPPQIDDLARLSLDLEDLRAAQKCKPGDCDFQMGAEAMELVRKVDWKSKSAGASFVELLRQSILDDLVAYQREGRMGVYVDNEKPESVADGLRQSLQDSPYLSLDSPFFQYVTGYPKVHLPDVQDVFYWSKEKVRDPVISLHHLIIQKTADADATNYTIADKHIADNHYFLAATEIVWLLDEPRSRPAFYAVRLNRTRIDPPRMFRGMLLGKIKRGMRAAMRDSLRETKARLEAAGALAGP